MFEKFLAFLGIKSAQIVDGKASFEMTEEQIKASGEIINERDKAIAEVARLTADLEAVQSVLAETQRQLDAVNAQNNQLTSENTRLTGELETLGNQAAAQTATIKTSSNAVKTQDASPCVTSESNDFLTNLRNVKEAYL